MNEQSHDKVRNTSRYSDDAGTFMAMHPLERMPIKEVGHNTRKPRGRRRSSSTLSTASSQSSTSVLDIGHTPRNFTPEKRHLEYNRYYNSEVETKLGTRYVPPDGFRSNKLPQEAEMFRYSQGDLGDKVRYGPRQSNLYHQPVASDNKVCQGTSGKLGNLKELFPQQWQSAV